jgi:hypothetical protein
VLCGAIYVKNCESMHKVDRGLRSREFTRSRLVNMALSMQAVVFRYRTTQLMQVLESLPSDLADLSV